MYTRPPNSGHIHKPFNLAHHEFSSGQALMILKTERERERMAVNYFEISLLQMTLRSFIFRQGWKCRGEEGGM